MVRRHPDRWLALLAAALALLLVSPTPPAEGADRGGLGTFRLKRDLGVLRSRVERAPRATGYDLDRLERRLHDQRLRAPRDPRLSNLEIESRRLRWQAERASRRGQVRRAQGLGPVAGAPIRPRYLDGAHTPDPAATTGIGARIVALQAGLRALEAALATGAAADAAQRLDAAAAELAFLMDGLSPATARDPNLVALGRQIDALTARLDARRDR